MSGDKTSTAVTDPVKDNVEDMLTGTVANLVIHTPAETTAEVMDVKAVREELIKRVALANQEIERIAKATTVDPGGLSRTASDHTHKFNNLLPNLKEIDSPTPKELRQLKQAKARCLRPVEALEALVSTKVKELLKPIDEGIAKAEQEYKDSVQKIEEDRNYKSNKQIVETPIRGYDGKVLQAHTLSASSQSFYDGKVNQTKPSGKKPPTTEHQTYVRIANEVKKYLEAKTKYGEAQQKLDAAKETLDETLADLKSKKSGLLRAQLLEWNNPSGIVYGTPLTGAQLNAKLLIGTGELTYTPGEDAILDAGTHTLTVEASEVLAPEKSTDTESEETPPEEVEQFKETSKSVQIVVAEAAREIVLTNTTFNIVYGHAFSKSAMGISVQTTEQTRDHDADLTKQLQCSLNGKVLKDNELLPAGTHTITIKAQPHKNFTLPLEKSITVTVTPADARIEWTPSVAQLVYGAPFTSGHLNARVTTSVASEQDQLTGMIKYSANGAEIKPNEFWPVNNYAIKAQLQAGSNYNPVADVTWNVSIVKATQTIQWSAPAAIDYGTPLSSTQLSASVVTNCPLAATQRTLTALTYVSATGQTLKPGQYLPAGTHTVTAKGVTPGDDKFLAAADKSVDIKVNKAVLMIKAKAPEPIETPVIAADMEQLRRKFKFSAGPDQLQFTVDGTPLNVGAVLTVGAKRKLKVIAPKSDNYEDIAPLEYDIIVSKQMPVINWKEPKPIVRGSALTATQLNAQVATGDGTLVYAPALGETLTCPVDEPSNSFLKATHPETKNFALATKSVRITVVPSVDHQRGYQEMRSGNDFDHAKLSGLQKQQVDDWNNDKDGVKTSTTELLKKLKELPGAELESFMDELIGDPTNPKLKSTANGNILWALPNNIQVRYKPNGDDFITSPMFCVEGRTCDGCSTTADDVAFKVTVDGAAGSRSPSFNKAVPNGTSATSSRKGSCYATHLQCAPKRTATVQWNIPSDLKVGVTFSDSWLTVVRDSGSITWKQPTDFAAPLKAGDYTAEVDLGATKRYETSNEKKPFKVAKALQKIKCGVTKLEIDEGATISLASFQPALSVEPAEAANIESGIVDKLASALRLVNDKGESVEGLALPVADVHNLRVIADANDNFEDAFEPVVLTVKAPPPPIEPDDEGTENS